MMLTKPNILRVAKWLAEREAHRNDAWETAGEGLRGQYRREARELLALLYNDS